MNESVDTISPEIHVGDKVQIKNDAIDVSNGTRCDFNNAYVKDGPLWCEVDLVFNNWKTGSRYNLPSEITKVRCVNDKGIVVWQVQPDDCINIIHAHEEPSRINAEVSNKSEITLVENTDALQEEVKKEKNNYTDTSKTYYSAYAPDMKSEGWQTGSVNSYGESTGNLTEPIKVSTKVGTTTAFVENENFDYSESVGTWRDLTDEERANIGANVQIDEGAIRGATFRTAYQNENKRKELLNEDIENIQNSLGFPYYIEPSRDLFAAKYDYQIIPGNPRYPNMVSLEDKLKEARASLGIPVHGSNMIARAMKYFSYNRWHSNLDTNLAHNKSFTYVFFTRPDLNIWDPQNKTANSQVINHSEAAMLWKRYPDIFKLLVDFKRTGDDNNFNLLLSNQVTSFDIKDESLTYNEAGKSWNEYAMQYGDSYQGRTAGEFTCNFTEVQDYSIIQLIKFWITYIDNVARGAWSPSYNLNAGSGWSKEGPSHSHVYTKTLDYGASAYVFKCGPDGEDVLYWSKYYGVFPINTGASALSWNIDDNIGNSPKPSISFRYSFKRDMSPISLLEFNYNSGIIDSGNISNENAFNVNYGHTSRPFVGAPYIELVNGFPSISGSNGLPTSSQKKPEIRLKFKKTSATGLTDDIVYRSFIDNRERGRFGSNPAYVIR